MKRPRFLEAHVGADWLSRYGLVVLGAYCLADNLGVVDGVKAFLGVL